MKIAIRKCLATWLVLGVFMGCADNSKKEEPTQSEVVNDTITTKPAKKENPFKGTKVPVLCYHAIREVAKNGTSDQKAYSVSPENFELQMKALADNGYTTITPDQLEDFQTSNAPLPEKPVMITFDDGRKEQFTIGAKIMEKYNFRGVYFIMTVSLGRKLFMTREDVKTLSDNGHVVGSHTWDHHDVRKYKDDDWQLQFAKPKQQLEKITQKPVTTFAYPFGAWNITATDSLKSHGYTSAFIFYGKQDPSRPMYTFERINIPYQFGVERFMKVVDKFGRE